MPDPRLLSGLALASRNLAEDCRYQPLLLVPRVRKEEVRAFMIRIASHLSHVANVLDEAAQSDASEAR